MMQLLDKAYDAAVSGSIPGTDSAEDLARSYQNDYDEPLKAAEALVRWRHPQKGLLYPSKFIPIFEKNGFIIELDYFVWEEVCKYIISRMDRGLAPINISLNITRSYGN